nr:LamG-like jellyroll fold domain-containing protein [Candidatus Sigynarchaeota archaeon]
MPQFIVDPLALVDPHVEFLPGTTSSEPCIYQYPFSVPSSTADSGTVEFDVYYVPDTVSPSKILIELLNQFGARIFGVQFKAGVMNSVGAASMDGTWLGVGFSQGSWAHVSLSVISPTACELKIGSTTAIVTSTVPLDSRGLRAMRVTFHDACKLDNIKTSWDGQIERFNYSLAPGTNFNIVNRWAEIDHHAASRALVQASARNAYSAFPASGITTLAARVHEIHVMNVTFDYSTDNATWSTIQTDGTRDRETFSTAWNTTAVDDGLYTIRAVAMTDRNTTGTAYMNMLVDNAPPSITGPVLPQVNGLDASIAVATTLNDTSAAYLVSRQAVYAFTISEPSTLELTFATATGSVITAMEIVEPPAVTGSYMVQASLADMWRSNPGVNFTVVEYQAADRAGNVGAIGKFEVSLDTTKTMAGLATTLSASYGSIISGQIVDSFGLGYASDQVDITIDGLHYASVITAPNGSFKVPVTSLDAYTGNLLNVTRAAKYSYGNQAVITGVEIPAINWPWSTDATATEDMFFVSRQFKSNGVTTGFAVDLTDQLANLSRPITAFEGFAIDLLLPAAFSYELQACTFKNITIEFMTPTLQSYPFVLDKAALAAYFDTSVHPESRRVDFGAGEFELIRIAVPFSALLQANPLVPFNASNIAGIKVTAIDNDYWTGSIASTAAPTQIIGIAGVYLADVLAGATTWASNAYAGNPAQVHLVKYAIPSLNYTCPATTNMTISPLTTTIQVGGWTATSLTIPFSDYLHVDRIVANASGTVLGAKISNFLVDSLYVSSDEPNPIGMPADGKPGIFQSTDIEIIGDPGTYAAMRLRYTGSPFFTAAAFTLASPFTIAKESLVVTSELATYYSDDTPVPSGNLLVNATMESSIAAGQHVSSLVMQGNKSVTPAYGAGFFGKALYLNGTTFLALNTTDSATRDTTVAVRVQALAIDGTSSLGTPLLDARRVVNGTALPGTAIGICPDGLRIIWRSGTIFHYYAFEPLSWYLIAVVFEPTAGRITSYVDGLLVKQSTGVVFNMSASFIPGNFAFGLDRATNATLAGFLDDVLVYERALAPIEITTLARTSWRADITAGELTAFMGNLRDDDNHQMMAMMANQQISSSFKLVRYNPATGAWVLDRSLPSIAPNSNITLGTIPINVGPVTAARLGVQFIPQRTRIDSIKLMTCDDNDTTNDPTNIVVEVWQVRGDVLEYGDTMAWSTTVPYATFTGDRLDALGWTTIPAGIAVTPGSKYCLVVKPGTASCNVTAGIGIYAQFSPGFAFLYNTTLADYSILGNSTMAIQLDESNYWDTGSTGLLQIETAPGTFQPYLAFTIGAGGAFGFVVDTAKNTPTYLPPGTYSARIVYDPVVLGGQANPRYETTSISLTLVVGNAPTELKFVVTDAASSNARDIQRNVHDNPIYGAEDGLSFNQFITNATYGDPFSMSFNLTAADGTPLVNKPVWVQVGITPNSLQWRDDVQGSTDLGYLLDLYPAQLVQSLVGTTTGLVQAVREDPIFYPYLEPVPGTVALRNWGPSAWLVSFTNAQGIATVNFADGLPIKDVVEIIQALNLQGTCVTVDDISLFARAFYDAQFSWAGKELSIPVDGNGNSLVPSWFANASNADWFENDGSHGAAYYDPYHADSHSIGRIRLSREQVMLLGGSREVSAAQIFEQHDIDGDGTPDLTGFPVTMQLVEANPTTNGTLAPETATPGGDTDASGWNDDFRVPDHAAAVYMELSDPATDEVIMNASSLQAMTNTDGTVDIYVSPEIAGLEWLAPGNYKFTAWSNETAYLAASSSNVGQITIKSTYSYNLSMPSLVYGLDYMLEDYGMGIRGDDLQTIVDMLAGRDIGNATPELPEWVTMYPMIYGMVSIRNTTSIFVPDPNAVDDLWAEYEAIEIDNETTYEGSTAVKGRFNPAFYDLGDPIDEEEFRSRYEAMYPSYDGANVTIKINGVLVQHFDLVLPGDCSDWEPFMIPLDGFTDWAPIDTDNDGLYDQFYGGLLYIDTDGDNVSDTWIEKPLDLTFEITSLANYSCKEVMIGNLGIVTNFWQAQKSVWNLTSELPSITSNGTALETGTYDHNNATGGSIAMTDPSGYNVTFSKLRLVIERDGPAISDIYKSTFTTPTWLSNLRDASGAEITNDNGDPIFGTWSNASDPAYGNFTGYPLDSNANISLRIPVMNATHFKVDVIRVEHNDIGYGMNDIYKAAHARAIAGFNMTDMLLNDLTAEVSGYKTTITFTDLFHDELRQRPAGVFRNEQRLNKNEVLLSGWQFVNSTARDGIKWADVKVGNKTREGIFMHALNSTAPSALLYPELYMPYRAQLNTSVVVPSITNTDGDAYIDPVTVSFIVMDVNDPLVNATFARSITTGSLNMTIPAIFDILSNAPAGNGWTGSGNSLLESRTCHVILMVSCADDANVYWIDPVIQGWESIITVSSLMPQRVKERLFSSQFLSFYCNNVTKNMGLDRYGGTHNGLTDDLQFAITGNLTGILNVQDYDIPSDPFMNPATATWDDIKNAFHEDDNNGKKSPSTPNGNDWTYYEMPITDMDGDGSINTTAGSEDDIASRNVFLRFKLDEWISTREMPTVASGIFTIYDSTGERANNPMTGVGYNAQHLAQYDRKVTVIVQPWHYYQFSNYWALSKPQNAASLALASQEFSFGDIVLNDLPANGNAHGIMDDIIMTYRKAPGVKDIVVKNFSQQFDLGTTSLRNALATNKTRVEFWDEHCFKYADQALAWNSPKYDNYYAGRDFAFGTNTALIAPFSNVQNLPVSYADETWVATTSPIMQVIPTSQTSIDGVRIWPSTEINGSEPDYVDVRLYRNIQQALPERDLYYNRNYSIVPDFSSPIPYTSTMTSTTLFPYSAWKEGYLNIRTGVLAADTGSLQKAKHEITVQCGAWPYDQIPETYFYDHFIINNVAGEKWAVLVGKLDLAPDTAFGIESAKNPALFSVPEAHRIFVQIGPKDISGIINDWFDWVTKSETPATVADKIYTALTANKCFMDTANIKVSIDGDVLTFEQDFGGFVAPPTVYPRDEANGNAYRATHFFYGALANCRPPLCLFSARSVATGSNFAGAGDLFINGQDGWCGFTVSFQGKYANGTNAMLNATALANDYFDTGYLVGTNFSSSAVSNMSLDIASYKASMDEKVDMEFDIGMLRASTAAAQLTIDYTSLSRFAPGLDRVDAGGGAYQVAWSHYKNFGYQVYATQPSMVEKITFIFLRAGVVVASFTSRFYNQSTIDDCFALPAGFSNGVDTVQYIVQWTNASQINNESCIVALTGFYFEHESSASYLKLDLYNKTSINVPVPITAFTEGAGFTEAVFRGLRDQSTPADGIYLPAYGEITFSGSLRKITLISAASIDLQQVEITRFNCSSGTIVDPLYAKSFDWQSNAIQSTSYLLGTAYVGPLSPEWVAAGEGCVIAAKRQSFVMSEAMDTDLNGVLDLAIQYYDQDGNASFCVQFTASTAFGVAPLPGAAIISVTGGATGKILSFDNATGFARVEWTSKVAFAEGEVVCSAGWTGIIASSVEITPYLDGDNCMVGIDGNTNGLCEVESWSFDHTTTVAAQGSQISIAQHKRINETRIDLDEDGSYNYIQSSSVTVSSKSTLLSNLTIWDAATSTWKHHAWKWDGSSELHEMSEQVDMDFDGQYEVNAQHADYWATQPRELGANSTATSWDGTRTYETHTVSTDGITEQSCDLEEQRTFIMLGPDGDQQVTCDVIVIDDPSTIVVTDPRTALPDEIRTEPGVIYFYDSDDNNAYETMYIFTNESYNYYDVETEDSTPRCIGVAYDYNGNRRLDWEVANFKTGGGDRFFPISWLDPREPFDASQYAYDMAWNDFMANIDGWWLVQQAASLAVSIGIMVLAGILGTIFLGPIGGFIFTMALFYLWSQASKGIWGAISECRAGHPAKATEVMRTDVGKEGVYPYEYIGTSAIGYADALDEDPSNKPDPFRVSFELPDMEGSVHGEFIGETYRLGLYQASTDSMFTHAVHDMYRGNGSFCNELYPAFFMMQTQYEYHYTPPRSNVTATYLEWGVVDASEWSAVAEIVDLQDVTSRGTYEYGDDYSFAITIHNNWSRVLRVGALLCGSAAMETQLSKPKSYADIWPGCNGTVLITGTIDNAGMSVRYTRDGNGTAHLYWSDTTPVTTTEQVIQRRTAGRLGRLMYTIDEKGRFGFEITSRSGPAPSYAWNAKETRDIEDAAGTVHVPWYMAPMTDPNYAIDYALMYFSSSYVNAYQAASSGDIFKGGDWRIALFNAIVMVVTCVLTVGISGQILENTWVNVQGVAGGQYEIPCKMPARFGIDQATGGLTQVLDKATGEWTGAYTYATSFSQWIGRYMHELLKEGIREELLQEEGLGYILNMFGCPDEISNVLSEAFGSGDVVRMRVARTMGGGSQTISQPELTWFSTLESSTEVVQQRQSERALYVAMSNIMVSIEAATAHLDQQVRRNAYLYEILKEAPEFNKLWIKEAGESMAAMKGAIACREQLRRIVSEIDSGSFDFAQYDHAMSEPAWRMIQYPFQDDLNLGEVGKRRLSNIMAQVQFNGFETMCAARAQIESETGVKVPVTGKQAREAIAHASGVPEGNELFISVRDRDGIMHSADEVDKADIAAVRDWMRGGEVLSVDPEVDLAKVKAALEKMGKVGAGETRRVLSTMQKIVEKIVKSRDVNAMTWFAERLELVRDVLPGLIEHGLVLSDLYPRVESEFAKHAPGGTWSSASPLARDMYQALYSGRPGMRQDLESVKSFDKEETLERLDVLARIKDQFAMLALRFPGEDIFPRVTKRSQGGKYSMVLGAAAGASSHDWQEWLFVLALDAMRRGTGETSAVAEETGETGSEPEIIRSRDWSVYLQSLKRYVSAVLATPYGASYENIIETIKDDPSKQEIFNDFVERTEKIFSPSAWKGAMTEAAFRLVFATEDSPLGVLDGVLVKISFEDKEPDFLVFKRGSRKYVDGNGMEQVEHFVDVVVIGDSKEFIFENVRFYGGDKPVMKNLASKVVNTISKYFTAAATRISFATHAEFNAAHPDIVIATGSADACRGREFRWMLGDRFHTIDISTRNMPGSYVIAQENRVPIGGENEMAITRFLWHYARSCRGMELQVPLKLQLLDHGTGKHDSYTMAVADIEELHDSPAPDGVKLTWLMDWIAALDVSADGAPRGYHLGKYGWGVQVQDQVTGEITFAPYSGQRTDLAPTIATDQIRAEPKEQWHAGEPVMAPNPAYRAQPDHVVISYVDASGDVVTIASYTELLSVLGSMTDKELETVKISHIRHDQAVLSFRTRHEGSIAGKNLIHFLDPAVIESSRAAFVHALLTGESSGVVAAVAAAAPERAARMSLDAIAEELNEHLPNTAGYPPIVSGPHEIRIRPWRGLPASLTHRNLLPEYIEISYDASSRTLSWNIPSSYLGVIPPWFIGEQHCSAEDFAGDAVEQNRRLLDHVASYFTVLNAQVAWWWNTVLNPGRGNVVANPWGVAAYAYAHAASALNSDLQAAKSRGTVDGLQSTIDPVNRASCTYTFAMQGVPFTATSDIATGTILVYAYPGTASEILVHYSENGVLKDGVDLRALLDRVGKLLRGTHGSNGMLRTRNFALSLQDGKVHVTFTLDVYGAGATTLYQTVDCDMAVSQWAMTGTGASGYVVLEGSSIENGDFGRLKSVMESLAKLADKGWSITPRSDNPFRSFLMVKNGKDYVVDWQVPLNNRPGYYAIRTTAPSGNLIEIKAGSMLEVQNVADAIEAVDRAVHSSTRHEFDYATDAGSNYIEWSTFTGDNGHEYMGFSVARADPAHGHVTPLVIPAAIDVTTAKFALLESQATNRIVAGDGAQVQGTDGKWTTKSGPTIPVALEIMLEAIEKMYDVVDAPGSELRFLEEPSWNDADFATGGYGILPLATVPISGSPFSLALRLRADGWATLEAWIPGSNPFELHADSDVEERTPAGKDRIGRLVEAGKVLGEVAAEVAAGRMSGIDSFPASVPYMRWTGKRVFYIEATVKGVEYHFAFFTSEQGGASHVPFLVKPERDEWPDLIDPTALQRGGLLEWYGTLSSGNS